MAGGRAKGRWGESECALYQAQVLLRKNSILAILK